MLVNSTCICLMWTWSVQLWLFFFFCLWWNEAEYLNCHHRDCSFIYLTTTHCSQWVSYTRWKIKNSQGPSMPLPSCLHYTSLQSFCSYYISLLALLSFSDRSLSLFPGKLFFNITIHQAFFFFCLFQPFGQTSSY